MRKYYAHIFFLVTHTPGLSDMRQMHVLASISCYATGACFMRIYSKVTVCVSNCYFLLFFSELLHKFVYVCVCTYQHSYEERSSKFPYNVACSPCVFFLFLCHTATSCINNIYNTLELSFVVVNMCCIGVYPFAPPGIICRIIK